MWYNTECLGHIDKKYAQVKCVAFNFNQTSSTQSAGALFNMKRV